MSRAMSRAEKKSVRYSIPCFTGPTEDGSLKSILARAHFNSVRGLPLATEQNTVSLATEQNTVLREDRRTPGNGQPCGQGGC